MAHIVIAESPSFDPFGLAATAKRLGHEVTVAVGSLDPYRPERHQSVLDQVDHVLTGVETADGSALAKTVRGIPGARPADGIVTLSSAHAEAVAHAAAELGLPGEDPTAVNRAHNKEAMRRRLEDAGIHQPLFAAASTANGAVSAAEGLGFPVVIKPVDGYGNRGVGIAHHAEETRNLASAALAVSDDGRSARTATRVLVEQYVPGPIVSCEMYVCDGVAHVFGCADRITAPPPHPVELGGTFPARLAPPVADKIAEAAMTAVQAVGLRRSHLHVELVLSEDGPQIIEINPRLVGGPVPREMSLVLDADVHDGVVAMALGDTPEPLTPSRFACLRSIVAPTAGVLTAVDTTEARHLPGVHDIVLDADVGAPVSGPRSNSDRVGFIYTVSESSDGAARAADEAARLVRVAVHPAT
ncbi:ATP-grasp domain-containing protein [Haloglycomyces albus]|uniref:ATP-grasp domain-containing protein n=1 Tax=Haloglycomyces albus TaxID=526067 RepID=UPI0004B09820|nr:ATP-grasp domain-containing protein [Haloglycomyces albus]